MENNIDLFNAAVIAENPSTAFIIEGDHLHAVEHRIADQKKDQAHHGKIVASMRKAFHALIKFSREKVEPQLLEIDWEGLAGHSDEQEQLISKIHHIFSHLPHHDRNELSSLIHHRQTVSGKG